MHGDIGDGSAAIVRFSSVNPGRFLGIVEFGGWYQPDYPPRRAGKEKPPPG
jgi:hypothetical protein